MKIRKDRFLKLLILSSLVTIGLYMSGLPSVVIIVLVGMLGASVTELLLEDDKN